MKTKVCTKCERRKPLSQFYQHSQGKRPGLVSARCKACEAVRMRAYYDANSDRKVAQFAQRYQALRQEVFNAYGGFKCACCGEDEPLFLTIDHVGGDGAEHRRKLGEDYRSMSGYRTYQWLRKNGFPPGFQVLCSNCNHGRHRNGGTCPHRSEGSTTIPKGGTTQAGRKCGAPRKSRG